jgi:transcriptional regulator of acetoin/glycerol metabolism
MREGRFRKDLYYRLSQVVLEVPPLRSRPDDVEALARHFLEKQRPELQLCPQAMEQLRSYSWPGNIRELKNLMTQLAIETDGASVEAVRFEHQSGLGSGGGTSASLEEIERGAIIRAMEATGGNQTKAAALLGISIRTIHRKLKSYTHASEHMQEAV